MHAAWCSVLGEGSPARVRVLQEQNHEVSQSSSAMYCLWNEIMCADTQQSARGSWAFEKYGWLKSHLGKALPPLVAHVGPQMAVWEGADVKPERASGNGFVKWETDSIGKVWRTIVGRNNRKFDKWWEETFWGQKNWGKGNFMQSERCQRDEGEQDRCPGKEGELWPSGIPQDLCCVISYQERGPRIVHK